MRQVDTVVILAAGDGDRFRPLTGKYLWPFAGKTLLRHVCDAMLPFGKSMVVIAASGNEDVVRKVVPSGVAVISQSKQSGGMGDAVLSCKGKLSGSALIIGNDIFDTTIIDRILEVATAKKSGIVLAAFKAESYFPGGYLILKDSQVIGIAEKPGAGNEPSPWVRFVADYIADIGSFMSELEHVTSDDRAYESALSTFMSKVPTDYVTYSGHWFTPKYPWNVLGLNSYFLSKIHKHQEEGCRIAPTALISGDVYLGKNVRIGDYVKITGPTYIGDDTVIGDYSLVRDSHIGCKCLIGSSTEVARSHISDRVFLHRNYIGDSVLAEGVLMGAGAVTANFRFDSKHVSSLIEGSKMDTGCQKLGAIIGRNAHIGVNVTLLPGVKVGAGATVGPGEVVVKDIPDESVIFTNRT